MSFPGFTHKFASAGVPPLLVSLAMADQLLSRITQHIVDLSQPHIDDSNRHTVTDSLEESAVAFVRKTHVVLDALADAYAAHGLPLPAPLADAKAGLDAAVAAASEPTEPVDSPTDPPADPPAPAKSGKPAK